MPPSDQAASPNTKTPKPKRSLPWIVKALIWLVGTATAGMLALLLIIGVALAMAYPNLPEITALSDYRPKLPLRVFSAEGELLAEYGEERSARGRGRALL